MHDFDALVLRRIWALRQFPAFADVELAELALLAENLHETRFATGDLVARDGAVDTVQLVVAGEITSVRGSWGPREMFGMFEALASRQLAAPARATRPTRALTVSTADLSDVLEEAFGVMRGTLHELALRVEARVRTARATIRVPDRQPLGLVDRLLMFRQLAPFATAHADALAALAHACDETTFAAGSVLARAGDRASATWIVLDGVVRASEITLGAGSVIGGLQALGELPHRATLEAATPVRVLACPTLALFDVLEDYSELGLAVLSSFATALL